MRSVIVSIGLVATLAVAGSPTSALAADTAQRPRAAAAQRRPPAAPDSKGAKVQQLRQMDANHDGQISRQEWTGPAKRFDQLDRNHDGVISKQELRPARAGRPQRG
ncbi:MAG: hypothetical protein ABI051_10225 [Vicinamibacterales bacterium]